VYALHTACRNPSQPLSSQNVPAPASSDSVTHGTNWCGGTSAAVTFPAASSSACPSDPLKHASTVAQSMPAAVAHDWACWRCVVPYDSMQWMYGSHWEGPALCAMPHV